MCKYCKENFDGKYLTITSNEIRPSTKGTVKIGIEANFCPHCGEPLTEPKPLSLDELRERDGKPVYIQMGDGAEFWAIAGIDGGEVYLYNSDYDGEYLNEDFYAMFFNDPDGHFGLHILGWAAYDRQPRREGNV